MVNLNPIKTPVKLKVESSQVLFLVIIGIAIIILLPIIKGVRSVAGVVGDILSAPADIINGLNAGMDRAMSATLKEGLRIQVTKTVYNPNSFQDKTKMDNLKKLLGKKIITQTEYEWYVKEWKKNPWKDMFNNIRK